MQLDADKMSRLQELARQVAEREGCRLYDIEFVGGSRGQGRLVRVYIDKAAVATTETDRNPEDTDSGTGVSIDDCANVSRGLNLLLDVEEIVPGGAYTLEVSSPGLDRLLREQWHFEAVIGQRIWVKSSTSMETERLRRQATGTLVAATTNGIQVQVDNLLLTVPYDIIERARLMVEWQGAGPDSGSAPQKGKAKPGGGKKKGQGAKKRGNKKKH